MAIVAGRRPTGRFWGDFIAPPGKPIAVKFVGSALVGIVAGLIGFGIGRFLPDRAGKVLHLLVWAMMIAAGSYLVGRETVAYILH